MDPPKWKPFFHLSNVFAQSFGLTDGVRNIQHPDTLYRSGAIEEFNFTKCALRYSEGLSKDQFSGALRLVIQTIGESMRLRSNTVILDFDVGRLSYGNCFCSFNFRRDLKEVTGCPGDLDLSTYMTSKTAGSTKSRGTKQSSNHERSVSNDASATPRRSTSSSHRSRSVIPTKQETVFQEALDRHLAELERRAREAVNAREEWKALMKASELQARNELVARRNAERKNLLFISDQIRSNEERRAEQHKTSIEAAGSHAFPVFPEVPRKKINTDSVRMQLDEQVRAAHSARARGRADDAALAQNMNVKSQKELAAEREREIVTKRTQQRALSDSWKRDMRIKECWKTISKIDIVP